MACWGLGSPAGQCRWWVGGHRVAPDALDPVCFERHQPVWRPHFFLSPSDLLIYTLDICIRHPCGLLPSKTSLKTKLRCTATRGGREHRAWLLFVPLSGPLMPLWVRNLQTPNPPLTLSVASSLVALQRPASPPFTCPSWCFHGLFAKVEL